MKAVGLLLGMVGWLIAIMATQVSNAGGQLAVVVLGFGIALTGVVGILNQAHLKEATWKR